MDPLYESSIKNDPPILLEQSQGTDMVANGYFVPPLFVHPLTLTTIAIFGKTNSSLDLISFYGKESNWIDMMQVDEGVTNVYIVIDLSTIDSTASRESFVLLYWSKY
jgi:hypothetical protein